jgi:hypothetical protein
MPHQYAASDTRTGLNVQVTGEFPEDPDDRVRIARTTNLFTRLMSTILSTENTTERRERFRAIETQLEVADALIRGDFNEVQRLVRETLHQMGVNEEQLRAVERQLREQLEALGAEGIEGFEGLFGLGSTAAPEAADEPPAEPPPQPRDDWLSEEGVDLGEEREADAADEQSDDPSEGDEDPDDEPPEDPTRPS